MAFYAKKASVLIASSCLIAPTQALEIDWSGFGTLGVGQTLNNSDAEYTANAITLGNGELDSDLSFDALSLIALQANADLQDGLSATVQIRATGGDDWDPIITWAYLSYDLTPTLKIQGGRKLIPLYAYTDSIDIGYTYHWIRPPSDVYSLQSNAYDGANLLYQDFIGDWEIMANGFVGRINDNDELLDSDISDEIEVSYRLFGGELEITPVDWLSFRVAAVHFEDFEIEPDSGTSIESFNADYYGAAIKLRPGNWFIIGEYTWYRTDQEDSLNPLPFGPDRLVNTQTINDLSEAWYVSAAYTFGKWTPHITFSKQDFKDQGSAIPAGLGIGQAIDTNTVIIGARYDFHPSASIKAEYHYFTDDTTQQGIERPQNGNPNDQTDAILIAVDFIF